MRRLMTAAIVMAMVLLMLSGCKQTAKNLWKDTQKYYREYLNTPATLDFESADAEPVEDRLATVFTPVGLALESFRRDMDNQDSFPKDEWFEAMFAKYPWLGGIAVIAQDGTVYTQKPETGLKLLNFAPLLEEHDGIGTRDLRSYAEDNPLGPEVYVAKPFFADNEFKGLVVGHFDPRSLIASVCPDPARLVILSPDHVLWTGHYIADTTPLVNMDWRTILKSETSDTAENELGEFLWVAKYLGSMPLIFAATTSEFPIDPSQLNALVPPEPVVMDVPTVQAAPQPEPETGMMMEEAPVTAAPVLEEGMVQPALNDEPGPATPTKDIVWSVQIGAFHNLEYAHDRIKLLQSFGYAPCLLNLYDKHGQLWHVVQIYSSPDKVDAFKNVREFHKKGTGLEYNVEALDAGVVSRRRQCF